MKNIIKTGVFALSLSNIVHCMQNKNCMENKKLRVNFTTSHDQTSCSCDSTNEANTININLNEDCLKNTLDIFVNPVIEYFSNMGCNNIVQNNHKIKKKINEKKIFKTKEEEEQYREYYKNLYTFGKPQDDVIGILNEIYDKNDVFDKNCLFKFYRKNKKNKKLIILPFCGGDSFQMLPFIAEIKKYIDTDLLVINCNLIEGSDDYLDYKYNYNNIDPLYKFCDVINVPIISFSYNGKKIWIKNSDKKFNVQCFYDDKSYCNPDFEDMDKNKWLRNRLSYIFKIIKNNYDVDLLKINSEYNDIILLGLFGSSLPTNVIYNILERKSEFAKINNIGLILYFDKVTNFFFETIFDDYIKNKQIPTECIGFLGLENKFLGEIDLNNIIKCFLQIRLNYSLENDDAKGKTILIAFPLKEQFINTINDYIKGSENFYLKQLYKNGEICETSFKPNNGGFIDINEGFNKYFSVSINISEEKEEIIGEGKNEIIFNNEEKKTGDSNDKKCNIF